MSVHFHYIFYYVCVLLCLPLSCLLLYLSIFYDLSYLRMLPELKCFDMIWIVSCKQISFDLPSFDTVLCNSPSLHVFYKSVSLCGSSIVNLFKFKTVLAEWCVSVSVVDVVSLYFVDVVCFFSVCPSVRLWLWVCFCVLSFYGPCCLK